MKSLEEFRKIATNVNHDYVQAFKAKGGKIIGYHCNLLPVGEIYRSLDMMAYRLRGNEATATDIGETYYGPVICTFPKCMLQMAGEGKYTFMDGLITSTGCDAMRRIYDNWETASEDYEGILPDFFYFFGVPHKSLAFSQDYFAEEIELHIKALEDHFGVKVTDDNLRKSIKLYNSARKRLHELDALRRGESVPIAGADALSVLLSACSMPVDDFIPLVEDLIGELKKSSESIPGKRLMLVGSATDDIEFVKVIEECGSVVVADSLCYGSRFFERDVSEEGDPVAALAKGYLDDIKCPRMAGKYKERREYILEKIEKAGVQGVVLQNLRFCDLHGSENGVLERDLEKMGIPCLVLERGYGHFLDKARIKMRMDAFLVRTEKN